jgi:acyl-CoA dehydrogenase
MANFNNERLFMAAQAYGFAQVCLEEALDWARQRHTFGQALSERQVVRHKLMDMQMRIDTARSTVHELAYRIEHQLGDPAQLVARIAMAKVLATQAMQFCADQALQILGGMGYMRGTRSERIYREVKVMMIGGGSEEIMKDLAARQLGI